MLVVDVPWWLKLWWKGVDISANVISGGLLALVALASWRWQQWKQRQITKGHRREDKLEENRAKYLLFFKRQQVLMTEAMQQKRALMATTIDAIAKEYLLWLETTKLRHHGQNWLLYDKWVKIVPPNGATAWDEENVTKLTNDIAHTVLPSIDDREFPW